MAAAKAIRADIQILRGLAVLLVVFYHLKIPGFHNGLLGVDIFFVISGYLMALLYDKRTAGQFYLARINRLLPAYAVVSLVLLAVGAFYLTPVDLKQLAYQASAGAGFVSNFYFWSHASYFSTQYFNPLLHYWSLAVEVQFYFFVPLLFPLLRRFKSLMLALLLVSLALSMTLLTVSPKTSFFMLPTRMWEFLIGAGAAWMGMRGGSFLSKRGHWLFDLALFLALAGVLVFAPLAPDTRSILWGHPSVVALVVCSLTAALLMLRAGDLWARGPFGQGLIKIGDLSYSLYLVHFPVIVLWNYHAFGGTVLGFDSAFDLAAMLLLSLALAWLSYHFIEQRNVLKFKTFKGAALVMLVLAALPFLTFMARWQVLDVKQQHIFAAWDDRSAYRCGKIFRILHPTEKVCALTPQAYPRAVLLLGNSHADSIKQPFSLVAAQHGYATLFTISNPPLFDDQLPLKALVKSLNNKTLDAVIFYFSPSAYRDETRRKILKEAVDWFAGQDVPIYFIAPTPAYSVVIPQHIYRSAVLGEDVPSIVQDEQAHRAANIDFWRFYRSIESEVAGLYDPAESLCAKGFCQYMSADYAPYYFDGHHLTNSGARVLDPLFNDLFVDLEAQAQP